SWPSSFSWQTIVASRSRRARAGKSGGHDVPGSKTSYARRDRRRHNPSMQPGSMELIIERRALTNEIVDARLHPVLRRAYAARGVGDGQELALTLVRLLPVSTLDRLEAAVQIILEHRDRRILVVGDFDADGATSTALIVRCLRSWGFASVEFLVPNRFEFGYGLTPEIVGLAAMRAPSLIVTVDNGISSIAGVAAARARGGHA